jgi:VWFA-related protein
MIRTRRGRRSDDDDDEEHAMATRFRRAAFGTAIVLGTAALTATGSAQFTSGVQVVSLTVTVSNRSGGYVSDLSPSDFVILEDGKPQVLSFFTASSSPVDLGLLLDSSSSMREDFHFAQEAASNLTRRLKPGDRAAVSGSVPNAFKTQPLTEDLRRVESAIRMMRVGGSTAIYEAAYMLLWQFQRENRGEDSRRQVIVLLSDGLDNASRIDSDELLDSIRRSAVAVYIIVLGDEMKDAVPRRAGVDPAQAWFAMQALARESGGRIFTPRTASELPGVYDVIAHELGQQYLLGYAPLRQERDGKFRRVSVRVQHPDVAQARTRAGYYALPKRIAMGSSGDSR